MAEEKYNYPKHQFLFNVNGHWLYICKTCSFACQPYNAQRIDKDCPSPNQNEALVLLMIESLLQAFAQDNCSLPFCIKK